LTGRMATTTIVLSLFLANLVEAQSPAFTGIVNPASNLPPGLPNYGIAQGSIFDIYGSNLGPASGVFASTSPLPTSAGLAGTVVTISGNGGPSLNAPLLYVGAGQIVAVIPSNAPVGTDTVTVTAGGKAGSTSVSVVPSAFGVSTVSGAGYGPAVVTFGDYSLVSATKSAKPGDTIVIWGTGLGAISGGDNIPAAGGNISIPLQVFIGGIQATVTYQGRTPGAIGLDQINATVSPGTPAGCNVAVVVQTNNAAGVPISVSNTPTIAVAPGGGNCLDPIEPVPDSAVASYLNKPIRAALTQIEQGPDFKDATVALISLPPAQSIASLPIDTRPSLNSCMLRVVPGTPLHGLPPNFTGLAAGPQVTLTPPSGSTIQVPAVQTGIFNTNLASVPGGAWQVAVPGGADVSALTLQVPVPPPLTWTNMSQVSGSAIDRTKPLQITWTGGDSNSYVRFRAVGTLGPSSNPTYTATLQCAAPSSAGSLTIPPAMLFGMPTGASAATGMTLWAWAYPTTLGMIAGFDIVENESDYELDTGATFK
jgi:uncharacterized protein (TIGR03437 family)